MTQPLPPIDPGNPLLDGGPARLTTSVVETADGQRLALTIRTASTTLTVFLNQDGARTWAANITGTAGRMSAAGLIVAPGNGLPVKGPG
jgi:hypothetical protein